MVEKTKFKRALAQGAKAGGLDGLPDDYCFSPVYDTLSCNPNLNNAISTVEVLDHDGQGVCMRSVTGVSLGELFEKKGTEYTFGELYNKWLRGRIVMNPRTMLL